MLPNKVIWFVGVDVEFVLSCGFDPLGRHGDESEQETLDSVCGLDSKEDSHEGQCHDVSVEVCRLPQQELFVAQILIKKVKLKCCGI